MTRTKADRSDDDARKIIAAAAAILRQGEGLLDRLPAEIYSRTLPTAFGASIGGHYRHCLDHFASLDIVEAIDAGNAVANRKNLTDFGNF